jgi:hypothetical protein
MGKPCPEMTTVRRESLSFSRDRVLHEPMAMERPLESPATEAADPRLISGIYNYCHRWCERCSLSDRCAVFRDTREYQREHPDSGALEQVEDSLRKTMALLAEWCEHEEIDLETILQEAETEEATSAQNRLDETIDTDLLLKAAKDYGHRTLDIVEQLQKVEQLAGWPLHVSAAVETISWYAFFLSAKIHRALYGLVDRNAHAGDAHAVQNDWNLSAKAARMAIAESCRAWDILLDAGSAEPQSPLRELVGLLQKIDTELAGRFPRAMESVRPGFDEPEVAAGALTTLACFEPRSWQQG